MDLSRLRLDLKNYCAQLEVFRLEKYLNQNHAKSLAEIEETAADLFSSSTIETLVKLFQESDGQTEIEQRARHNLLGIARLGFLQRQTKEISQELENCQKTVHIKFRDEVLTFTEALEKIAFQEIAENRSEIFARVIDSQNSCANLFVEKLSDLQKTSQKLGFANLQKLYEEITEINFEDFARKATSFLENTEENYFRSLSGVAREAELETKKLSSADVYFLREKLERQQIFSGQSLPALYDIILENFGFNSRKITNIEIIKTFEQKRTECFCPNPPEKVNFCISNRNGVSNFTEFLHCFARVNQTAWTSKELSQRFPEFVSSPDDCLPAAYGILFQSLLTSKQFLQQSIGIWGE
ncbi:MAG: hypothetical protein M3521_10960, partial [Acidobacteriota bacterium]|nr:hypothetical protein [Acidobacteriota bacterium]